jgi:hypothetical protein
MNLLSYFKGLTEEQQNAYAVSCGTTLKYLTTHIMRARPYKTARPDLISALAKQSRGAVSYDEALAHFYPEKQNQQATKAAT